MVSGQPPRRRRGSPQGEPPAVVAEAQSLPAGLPTEPPVSAHVLGDIASRRLARAAAAAGAAAAGSVAAAADVAAVDLAAATAESAESAAPDSGVAAASAELVGPKPRKPRKPRDGTSPVAASPYAEPVSELADAATATEANPAEAAAPAEPAEPVVAVKKLRKATRKALGPAAPSAQEQVVLLSAAAATPIEPVADAGNGVPAPELEAAWAEATPPEPDARIEEIAPAEGVSDRIVESRFVAGLGTVALGARMAFGFAGAAAAFVAAPVGRAAGRVVTYPFRRSSGWWRDRRVSAVDFGDAPATRRRRRRPALGWVLFTAFYLTLGSALIFQGVVVPILGHAAATGTAGYSPANLIVGLATSSPSPTASATEVAQPADPTATATATPTASPSVTATATASPTHKPTAKPTPKPTAKPKTPAPTVAPTAVPTPEPTATPTASATDSAAPSSAPTPVMFATLTLSVHARTLGRNGTWDVTSLPTAVCILHRSGGDQADIQTNPITIGASGDSGPFAWGSHFPAPASGTLYTFTAVCQMPNPDNRASTSTTIVMGWP